MAEVQEQGGAIRFFQAVQGFIDCAVEFTPLGDSTQGGICLSGKPRSGWRPRSSPAGIVCVVGENPYQPGHQPTRAIEGRSRTNRRQERLLDELLWLDPAACHVLGNAQQLGGGAVEDVSQRGYVCASSESVKLGF